MPLGKDQEKTEPATPKRREEARKKGQVAHSREVPSVLVLLSSLGVLFFSGSFMFWHISSYMGGTFQNLGAWQFGDASIQVFLLQVMKEILVVLAPLMIFVLVEAALIAITGGLCSCVAFPVNIGIAIFSAIRVRDYVHRTRARGSVLYVIIAGIIGLVVVVGLVVGLVFLLVTLGLVGSLSAGENQRPSLHGRRRREQHSPVPCGRPRG